MSLVCVYAHSVVSDFVTQRTVAHQTPLSMGFSRHEYWSGLPFLLQGVCPIQGSLLHWQVGSLPQLHLGSPLHESLTILLLSFGSVVTSPLSFLILVICVFSTFVLCQYS